ncbi:AIPR family protein [Corynebacterium minutissimum]|uniref:AIPR family protein n=1 Tax=Corynebacterium minutissimum TaxID=38301 RepID=UPI001EF397F2|nr:AIPR family protein [Corynebacterium minutissimum]MCG7229492.1 AIPR family protein [Corynebacterium minutissimum]MCG7239219.1 AIPR family protein [Corynebacterium minutissimum]
MKLLNKSRLRSFASDYGIAAEKDEEVFEYYTTHHFLSRYVSNDIRVTEKALVAGDDGGIDAMGILINGSFAEDASDVNELIREDSENTVRVGFLQAKTSAKYDTKLVTRFLNAINRVTSAAGENDFSKLEPALREKAEALAAVINKIQKFSVHRIPCDVFYVTLSEKPFGSRRKGSNVVTYGTQVDDELKRLEELDVYDFKNLKFVGQEALDERVEELRGQLEAKFTMSMVTTIPSAKKIKRAVMGVIPVSELQKIILDDNGELRENIFEGNVRLYQGEGNEVNQAISRTLRSDERDKFPFLNNGLTVVARQFTATFDQYHMKGYQIVNGCQTTNEIARWLQALESDPNCDAESLSSQVLVPIKIINTDDRSSARSITVATNSQTTISKQDIQGNTELAMRVEEYFEKMPESEADLGKIKLRYKRQSGESQDDTIPGLRTFDTRELSRAYAACVLGESSTAIGQPNKLSGEDSIVWTTKNSEALFYFSALILYRVERALVRPNANGIKPAKFHIAMMAARYALPELDILKADDAEISDSNKKLERVLESEQWVGKINSGINEAIEIVRSYFKDKLETKSLVKDDVRAKKVQDSLLQLWRSEVETSK